MPTSAQYLASNVSGGSTWLTPDNVMTDDDSYASSTVSRTLDYPYGYKETRSSTLTALEFAGIDTGFNLGDTIKHIEWEVRAKASRSDVEVELVVGGQRAVLTTDWAVYTFTEEVESSSIGFVSVSLSGGMVSGNGSATVYIEYIKATMQWDATAPSALTFPTVTGVAVGQWAYSSVETVAGIPVGVSLPWYFIPAGDYYSFMLYVPEYEIQQNNDGRWMSWGAAGTTQSGDTFQMRGRFQKAAAAVDAGAGTLYINSKPSYFTVNSTVPDRSPVLAPLPVLTDLPRSQWVHAGTQRVYGTDATSEYEVDLNDGIFGYGYYSGEITKSRGKYYDLNTNPLYVPFFSWAPDVPTISDYRDGQYTWPVTEGTEIALEVLTPATFSELFLYGFLIGDQSVYATATTESVGTPTQVFFTTPAPVATSTVSTSNMITIAGLRGAASVSFSTSGGSAHQYQKNAGAWTSVGATTVSNGDTISLRMTSSGSGSASCSITMNAGGMCAAYNIVTTGGDVTPDAFTFTDVTNALPGVMQTSNAITVAGTTGGQALIITVTPGFEIQVGAGAWTAGTNSCTAGNTVTVRSRAGLRPGEVKTCVVTIGGTQDTWTITTRTPPIWD